jgi:hypothetical protein
VVWNHRAGKRAASRGANCVRTPWCTGGGA